MKGLTPRCGWLAGALLLLLVAPALARAEASAVLPEAVDEQVERGWDHPVEALRALDALATRFPAGAGRTRMLLLGRGLVAASSAREADTAEVMSALARLEADPLSKADVELVRATRADADGDGDAVMKAASAALDIYRLNCPEAAGCDYRSSWHALKLLARHEALRGQSHIAFEYAQAAADLAASKGDRAREALSRGMMANVLGEQGDAARAHQQLVAALQLARSTGLPAIESRLQICMQIAAERRGDLAAAWRAASTALALARLADTPRLVAQQQGNLADIAVKSGRAREAMTLSSAALPVARAFGDRRAEQVALHNLALARIAMGQKAAARKALDELLAVHHRSGALALEAETLREFSEAFARAGDMRAALDLFHRERALTAEIMAANRDAVLSQLRARYDREAQQRQLTRLERENVLADVRLQNARSMRRLWIGSGAILALAVLLLLLLYLRVREINLRLGQSRDILRGQSQRDPLTGLANRRRVQELAAGPDGPLPFRGALLLVDVDHFKRINDQLGHAVGDQVLIELGRRLCDLVRGDDLVVRWGGEEFLIMMPEGGALLALELAERVLHGIGSQPLPLPERNVRITVSIGFASYPMAPHRYPVPLERGINLADMALISAKREGRNRAVGIESLDVADVRDLLRAEVEFDQMLHDGRLTVRKLNGPSPPLAVVAGAA